MARDVLRQHPECESCLFKFTFVNICTTEEDNSNSRAPGEYPNHMQAGLITFFGLKQSSDSCESCMQ